MKLLQINASYKPAYIYGGPTMSVSKLCEQMVQAGCAVEVYTTTANGPVELIVVADKRVEVEGVPVTYFKRITKDHSHLSPALMRALWKTVKDFDVVHVHAWWNLVSIFSCWIALKRGVPVVLSPRGTLSVYSFVNKNNLPKKLIHSLVGKAILKKCCFHTTSPREQAAINDILQPKTIFNIPNFIQLPVNSPMEISRQAGPLKLLFFSRIEEKKGLDILFNALPTVTIPWHLTIAGDGKPEYIEQLKTIAHQNGISASLSWIGFQGDNKFDLLQQHDLMILPSYDENFGNVVIESLSMGTAVLISKNVGLADYVAENNFGWVCELDKYDISNFINQIGTEGDKLTAIRQQAPTRIREDFNEENLTGKYIDMYTKIKTNGSI